MSLLGDARDLVAIVREENIPFMAASISYYAIVSTVPLVALVLALLGVFGAGDVVLDIARGYLDGGAERTFEAVLTATRGRSIAGVLGFLFVLWSALKVFRGLTVAFAQIYREDADLTLVDQLLRSLVVFGTLLVALALLAATSLVGFLQVRLVFPTLVSNAAAFLLLVVVLLPLYYLLPPVPVTLTQALPGAVVTALGWVVLQVAFFYYVRSAGSYAAYGLLGAVLLFVTFLYLAAIVLLVGVVVNVADERRPFRSPGE